MVFCWKTTISGQVWLCFYKFISGFTFTNWNSMWFYFHKFRVGFWCSLGHLVRFWAYHLSHWSTPILMQRVAWKCHGTSKISPWIYQKNNVGKAFSYRAITAFKVLVDATTPPPILISLAILLPH